MSAHPLDPLTADEVATACRIAKEGRGLDARLRFPVVVRCEPAKDDVLAWKAGDPLDRRAELVVLDRDRGLVSEAVVSVTDGRVVSWRDLPGARPPLLFTEAMKAVDAVKSDTAWLAAMARRGVTDLEHVQIDPWPAGNFGLDGEDGRRLTRCVAYVRDHPTDNGYARPVEGLVAVVDFDTMKVVQLVDGETVPVPGEPGNYDLSSVGPLRTGLHPVAISQPGGPSFELDGHKVGWQGWSFRFSVHPIEGLVLHLVSYQDRSILYRAGIAEMVVPYGDTATNHWWKNAFDAGEWGLGRMMQSLTNGCDCLGEIRYADAVMADETGGATVLANAVCLHEEDYGILWKHVDGWTGVSETRRSQRLVISAISTVGNYEYAFYWYFYLDGTIQLEVKLTGILQTSAIEPGGLPAHGVAVSSQLAAPHHQHLLCARLDIDLDGTANSVFEVDAVGAPIGPDNPHGNAVTTRTTLLASESQAQRMVAPLAGRAWKIVNPSAPNRLGHPVGYRLLPGPGVQLLADPNSSIARRAAFATRSLWVTPYRPEERRAAGEYPNQSAGGEGLPAWTAADRPLEDTDVVLWHTFGVTHVARPEDWPVMPVESVGFCLKPDGFFDRNPALDVTPPGHCQT